MTDRGGSWGWVTTARLADGRHLTTYRPRGGDEWPPPPVRSGRWLVATGALVPLMDPLRVHPSGWRVAVVAPPGAHPEPPPPGTLMGASDDAAVWEAVWARDPSPAVVHTVAPSAHPDGAVARFAPLEEVLRVLRAVDGARSVSASLLVTVAGAGLPPGWDAAAREATAAWGAWQRLRGRPAHILTLHLPDAAGAQAGSAAAWRDAARLVWRLVTDPAPAGESSVSCRLWPPATRRADLRAGREAFRT